jgi:hypothetical protein
VTRAQAIKLAQEAAAGDHRPSYNPEPATFEPHEWVVDAVLAAYRRGFVDGVDHIEQAAD